MGEVVMSGGARDLRPADRWEIVGADDDPRLVLSCADGTALSIPLEGDLLDACAYVRDLRAGAPHDGDEPTAERVADDDEEADEPGDGMAGALSRVSGWHQIDALWAGLSSQGRVALIAVIAAAFLVLALVAQFS